MSYNISGEPLKELRASTKENPSGIFVKDKVGSLWQYIDECCQVDKHQTHFCFGRKGEVYEVDIIGNSLAIYKHDWKPQSS